MSEKYSSDYDPTKKSYHNHKYKCIFRYDDVRPNRGKTRLGRLGKENPEKVGSGGSKSLIGRCRLINRGNRKCLFPESDHLSCKVSTAKKHKHKAMRKFKGKWKKTVQ